MDLYYRMLRRIMTPAGGRWILRMIAAGTLAVVAFLVIPRISDELRVANGIHGAMLIESCAHDYADQGRGVVTKWDCTGQFTGDDGTRIGRVAHDFVQNDQPTGAYRLNVTSPTATRAYAPGRDTSSLSSSAWPSSPSPAHASTGRSRASWPGAWPAATSATAAGADPYARGGGNSVAGDHAGCFTDHGSAGPRNRLHKTKRTRIANPVLAGLPS